VGPLAFLGAVGSNQAGSIERELLEYASGEVVLLPTGAAYERPALVIERVTEHFAAIGQMAFSSLKLFEASAEANEGITAFNEKRAPDFSAYRGD